jgi:hypothetical protein
MSSLSAINTSPLPLMWLATALASARLHPLWL